MCFIVISTGGLTPVFKAPEISYVGTFAWSDLSSNFITQIFAIECHRCKHQNHINRHMFQPDDIKIIEWMIMNT